MTQAFRSKARYRVEPDFDKSQVIDDESGVIEVWAFPDLAEQSAGRLNRINELETVLRNIEWVTNGYGQQYCPSCKRNRPYGHFEDCQLATVVKGK